MSTTPAPEVDLWDEWSKGANLANNSFFEEIPLELNNPQNFSVPPESIPNSPVPSAEVPVETPVVVPPVEQPVEPTGPEVRKTKKGGSITLEKTNRGWRATINNGDGKSAEENFYAANKDELIFNICEAKVESNLTILRLKKEKLLGSENTPVVTPNVAPTTHVVPKVSTLTADDEYEIKNKLQDTPSAAFDAWVKKRFGLEPEELAEALKAAPEARKIAEAQKIQSSVEEVNQDFVRENPDWVEEYSANPANIRRLVARLSKVYLNKRLSEKTPQNVVDDTIYELFSKGFWTVENLETAKEELVDSGLLETVVRNAAPPRQEPKPEASAPAPSPSVPVPSHIATTPGPAASSAVLGIPARSSAPTSPVEEKTPTVRDLYTLPMDQLRLIAQAQLREMQKNQQ